MSTAILVTADMELARVVKLALRDTPVRLTSICGSAREAIDHYSHLAPSIVILDLFLPESSGLEVLKTLKRLDESGLFVLLSRMRTRNVLERAFRQGAQDVLLYPTSTEVLRETILRRLEAQPTVERDAPPKEP